MLNVNEFFKNICNKLFKDKIILLFGIIIFLLFIYSITYSFNTYRNYSVLWNIPSKYKLEKIDTLKNYFVKEELSPNEKGGSIGGILNPIIGLMGVLLTFLAFYVQYQANNRILNFDEEKKILLNKKIQKAIVWELEQVFKFLQVLDKEYDIIKSKKHEIKIVEMYNTYIVFEWKIFNSIDHINIIDVFEDNDLIDIYKIINKVEYLKKNIPSKLNETIQQIPSSNREEEINKVLSHLPLLKETISKTKELIRPIVLKYKK
jgi:hypothetical protein